MRFHVLTLFPEMMEHGLHQSILGRAAEKGQLSFHLVNIRDYTQEKHGKVDDYPYGGGAGMLMQAQPVYDAYRAVVAGTERNPSDPKLRTIYVTPQGKTFTQEMARELAQEEELVFLCGHYEGIDERVLEEIVTDYVSIGDYVLTGGELPAMVMIDAIARMVPGVLHNEESAETESFHRHLLEYPQYSRPEVWHEKKVPEVLLSGNHKQIEAWRLEHSVERTRIRRPELYAQYQNEQRIIRALAKQKRKWIHMMEMLARGRAKILCQQDENLLMGVENRPIYALHATSWEAAARLITCDTERKFSGGIVAGRQMACSATEKTQEQLWLAVCGEELLEPLVQQYGLEVYRSCYQACYTRKETLRVPHKDIRLLTEADLAYAAAGIPDLDRDYLLQRIRAGAMYGIYMEQGKKLAGFIGLHQDGGMGMLFVEEAYRRQGLAISLESWLINQQLQQGQTPFCQIGEKNESALQLQEKLGLYLCTEPMWWLKEEICKSLFI